MKKNTFLLLLLMVFSISFGQIGTVRNVRIQAKGADNSMVTGPTNGVSVTNTSTLVTTTKTMTNGMALFTNTSGLIQGDTYTYDIAPPACYVDQTHSTGSFVVAVTTDPNFNGYYIYATPFAGVSPLIPVVTRTIKIDGKIPGSNVVVKIAKHDVNGSNGTPGPDYGIPYQEIIGTTDGTGLYSFANVALGQWDVIVEMPCIKTYISKNSVNNNCSTDFLNPPSSSINVNTTTYGFTVGTGGGYSEILLTDCNANYPVVVSGGTVDGSIVDGTQYTVNYTYTDVVSGTAVTVTSPVVTSFPSYNSAPNWNNNTNRLQFTPEGNQGDLLMVNFLTPVGIGNTCLPLTVGKSTNILGPPLGKVSFRDSKSGFGSTIIGGTLINTSTSVEYSGVDAFSTFEFTNIPPGTYTANLLMTNCRAYTQTNIVVNCASILGGNTATFYTIDGATVPTPTTNDLYVNLGPISGIGFGVYGAKIRVYNADKSYDQTIASSSDINLFTAVPYGEVTYEVTKNCNETVTGTTTIDCNGREPNDVFVPYGTPSTTNDLYVNLGPISGIGFGVYGAKIRVYNADMSYDQTIESSSDLNLFTAVPYGDVTYVVSKNCNETVTGTTTIDCNAGEVDGVFVPYGTPSTTNDLYVNLGPASGIGFGVYGAKIRVYNADMSYDQTIESSSDLNFFGAVPFGEVTYVVTQECMESVTGTTTINCNAGEPNGVFVPFGVALTSGQLDVDVSDGMMPIYGAKIRVYNAELNYDVTIDPSSSINTFSDVPYGEFTYEVSYTCKETAVGKVTIACNPDNFTFLPVVLSDATKNGLSISINDGTNQVGGAKIVISNDDNTFTKTINSVNVDGIATFFNVPYGNINYTITGGECLAPKTGSVTVDCNNGEFNSTTVTLFPTTIGNLNLSVTDGTNELSGASIHLFNTAAGYDVTATSSGYNYFKNVPYGELSYVISMTDKTTATGTITIACAKFDITEATVVLTPALGVSDFNTNTFNAVSFPNPFAKEFAIKVTSLNQNKVNIKVYDMVGRLIEQRNADVSELETTQIGNNYPSGVYNVVVTQDKNVKTLRVIKR